MSFTDISMQSIAGETVDFNQFADQFNLIVNVASR